MEGIDGCWIGPGDLSRFMRLDLGTPEGKTAHTAAIRGIIEVCRKTGKIPGISMGTAPGRPAVDWRGLPLRYGWRGLKVGCGEGTRDARLPRPLTAGGVFVSAAERCDRLCRLERSDAPSIIASGLALAAT